MYPSGGFYIERGEFRRTTNLRQGFCQRFLFLTILSMFLTVLSIVLGPFSIIMLFSDHLVDHSRTLQFDRSTFRFLTIHLAVSQKLVDELMYELARRHATGPKSRRNSKRNSGGACRVTFSCGGADTSRSSSRTCVNRTHCPCPESCRWHIRRGWSGNRAE